MSSDGEDRSKNPAKASWYPRPPSRSSRTESIPPRETSVLGSHPPRGAELTFVDFFEYFSYCPTALAIKECVRLKRMKELPIYGPVLDVGCGDGLFTSLAYPEVDSWGIDVNEREAARAQASKAYRRVLVQSVTDEHGLPPAFFSTCVANCSLEHVPDIRSALRTIRRALRPGGLFYLIVPRADWTTTLPVNRALRKVGLGDLARAYSAALDAQFAHHHLYDADHWSELLREAGFDSIEHELLGSDGSQAAFEAWLLPSVVGYLTKKLTGHWVVAQQPRRLYAWPVFQAVRWLASRDTSGGAEILLVCRAGGEAR